MAPSLSPTSDERPRLERWARGRSTPPRLALRAQIVLRAAGAQNQKIAEELGTQRTSCALWRNRFHHLRLAGIEQDAPRPGDPLRLPDATIRAFVHDTPHTQPPNVTHWSTRSLAEKYGVSPNTVHQIWTARQIQPHRLEHYKLSRDKRFEEKLRDLVGLYLNPPEHALVPSVDEKTQIRGLDRTQLTLPVREGTPARQVHNYRPNGTTDLFAALDVPTGKIAGECDTRHGVQEFLSFLRTLDRTTPPAWDLHLILDNLATDKTAKVKRWVLRHPRFHFHFVPTGSSWLSQVERWFKELTDKRVRRGTFHSELEMIGALKLFVERYNEDPRPFVWRATADRILEKVRWNRLNVDLSRTAP